MVTFGHEMTTCVDHVSRNFGVGDHDVCTVIPLTFLLL